MNKQDITAIVKSQQQQLKDVEHRVDLYGEFIRGQQLQKQQSEQEIERLKPMTTMVKIKHKYYNKYRESIIIYKKKSSVSL